MIRLKTAEEIETLAQGGALLAGILEEVVNAARPGVTSRELDALARELIRKAGATPSFLNYKPDGHTPFPAALCVSVNNAVVHGLPGDVPLAEGDSVGFDLGIIHHGLFLDAARTIGVGSISRDASDLLHVTRDALAAGIAAARVGNTVGDIGAAVQNLVEGRGFSVVRQLVGHGVGHAVHEDPPVPNYGKAGKGLKLEEGLVIAIEPMVTVGEAAVETGEDGWTVETVDGSLAAHEEHTVAILPEGPRILTTRRAS